MNSFEHKISNPSQLGGIETSVLDNGAGRGTRIAWINTGTGLRYKVVIDRAMDIADAFYNQHSIAWLSHLGITSPQPFTNRDLDWLRTFGGGLLATCGLDHVGGPEKDEHGERGIHGLVSNLPAEIESIIQPNPVHGNLNMSITGKIRQTKIFGPSLELRRTISGKLGDPSIHIHDEVMNVGNLQAPHMLLYHFNFGWPLADEGSAILWKGSWSAPRATGPDRIFREGNNFRLCPSPMVKHDGTGEEVAFIDIESNNKGECICGIHNQKLGLALSLTFQKSQLPWLTNWQHWGHGEYVTGIEPGTHPPIGQSQARREKTLILLEPGEKRIYDVHVEVIDNEKNITDLIRQTKP